MNLSILHESILNFGHTFGHAVEAVCGFGGLSHGESCHDWYGIQPNLKREDMVRWMKS